MKDNLPISIGIADDEALFRRGIRLILEDDPAFKIAFEAANGQELLDKIAAASQAPDVLILDLKMPVMDGIEAAKILRQQHPAILLIVVSSHVSKSFILNMIEIGAASYLGKSASPEEMVETIHTVMEKGFCYNSMVMEVIRESLSGKTIPKASSFTQPMELTSREQEILQLICEEFTNAEIADKLYISNRTVEGHRNNLLSKLGCRNTAGLVVYALQHNLVKIGK